MARILVSIVGMQDPLNKEGERGPILTAVEALKPDEAYLIYTSPPARSHTEDHAKQTRTVLLDEYDIPSNLLPIRLADPTDYAEILNKFQRVTEEIRELPPENEIIVAVSSGTPAMQACWLLLISQGQLPAKAYRVIEPKYVEAGQPVVKEVAVDFLQEDSLIKTARQHFRTFNFNGAEQVLTELSQCCGSPDRRVRANWLAEYCRILGLWDSYRLGEAAGRMRRFVNDIRGMNWEAFMIPQIESFEELKEDQGKSENIETSLILTDLYFNADRCYHRGYYVDALARAWRTYEGALRYWLLEKHGIPANATAFPDDQKRELVEFMERNGIHAAGNGELNRHALEMILVDFLQDEHVRRWQGDMGGFGNVRNKSIAAHGTQEIKEDTVRKALDRLKVILELCGCELEEYTFASRRIVESEGCLFEVLFKRNL